MYLIKNCEPEYHCNNEGKGSYGVDHGSNKGWRSVPQACKVHIESQTYPALIFNDLLYLKSTIFLGS